MHPAPTAVFAANDAMALGLLSALRDAGVRVPQEIAIAGFDDIPISRYVTPPLTTVKVPITELGRRAFALAISDEEQRHEILPTTLVIRESCGATTQREGAKS
jgi:LacI family transcriptional regulator